MSDLKPVSITANRQSAEMTVVWQDQHTSVYPFYLLRAGCPCASCRGEDNMRPEPDDAVFHAVFEDSPKTRMSKVEGVGSYGITVEWEDGHHFGIYSWPYLRALCPCPVCRKEALNG